MDDFDEMLEGLVYELNDNNYVGRGDKGTPVTVAVRVFRVEMPDGIGPFNDDRCPDHEGIYYKLHQFGCDKLAGVNHEQMGITEHAFKIAHGHASYACDSTDGIKAWFCDDARRYLREKWEAKLVEYEVPVGGYLLTIGNSEVIFSKLESKKVAERDLITMEIVA